MHQLELARQENLGECLEYDETHHASMRQSSFVWFLDALPKRAMSRAWGAIHHVPLPVAMREPLYRLWGWYFNSDLEESAHPLWTYTCLAEFFLRPLIPGVRPIEDAPLVSPVDAVMTVQGKVQNGYLEQIKVRSGF